MDDSDPPPHSSPQKPLFLYQQHLNAKWMAKQPPYTNCSEPPGPQNSMLCANATASSNGSPSNDNELLPPTKTHHALLPFPHCTHSNHAVCAPLPRFDIAPYKAIWSSLAANTTTMMMPMLSPFSLLEDPLPHHGKQNTQITPHHCFNLATKSPLTKKQHTLPMTPGQPKYFLSPPKHWPWWTHRKFHKLDTNTANTNDNNEVLTSPMPTIQLHKLTMRPTQLTIVTAVIPVTHQPATTETPCQKPNVNHHHCSPLTNPIPALPLPLPKSLPKI